MNINMLNFLRNNVLFFTPKEYKTLVKNYLRFFELGINMAADKNLSTEIKLKKISLLQKGIYRPCPFQNNLLKYLQINFVKQNLSLSLLNDCFKVFSVRASYDGQFKTWAQMVDYFQSAVSPMVRLIMVLNNLSPSVYLPFASLGVASLLVYTYVSGNYKKPENLELLTDEEYKNLYVEKVKGLFKSSRILPQIVYSHLFRLRVCIALAATKIFFKKINKNKRAELDVIDYVKAMIYGTFKWMFTKTKSLNTEGI